MTEAERIPFEVEPSRIIELLAKQIYQSPMALLRENVQNAFDAVRERQHLGHGFAPAIEVLVERERITIIDNGVGMSPQELRRHFWTAGSSSKNTPEARAAGVVGTFGIGAMANFGVARSLAVETESARTGERTLTSAQKDSLSLKDDCVKKWVLAPTGEPGTKITAELSQPGSIDVTHAQQYVREFVRLVAVPVRVNGVLVSQVALEEIVPQISAVHFEDLHEIQIGQQLRASGSLSVSANAVVRLALQDITWAGRRLEGHVVIRSTNGALQTARSGFGLSIAPVNSIYAFGGVADLQVLEPTAGREALTSEGVQLLQAMMLEIDAFVSVRLSNFDTCNASTPFMQWVYSHGRYDLAGRLTIEVAGREETSLEKKVALAASHSIHFYGGVDPNVIKTFSSEDSTLLILSRTSPRRQCQEGYLARHASVQAIPDRPMVGAIEEKSGSRWGVAYRLETIIEDDYFVQAAVVFAQISHGVSVLLEPNGPGGKPRIVLASDASGITTLMQIYETHIEAFRSLSKDFVRNVIFPHISHLVPSSTRQGAEAFIEALRKKRETFEYGTEELDDMPSIWEDYREGRITLDVAIDRSKVSARMNVQYVDAASSVRDVVPDILDNEVVLQQLADQNARSPGQVTWPAAPPIMRTDITSPAKLITIDQNEGELRGYRCFIALAPRAYDDFGDFFTQPHNTSVVWAGQKALFIFIHHSGEFGIYYDMQTSDFVSEQAGGGSQATCTIIIKSRIYIPVPAAIQRSFIPQSGETKRFEIKTDLIRTSVSRPTR